MKTNASLREISYYHQENEVLFFPFSSFELVNVEEYSEVFLITFNYSLDFKNKVRNCSYFDENSRIYYHCNKSIDNCKKCLDASLCTLCEDGYTFING